MKCCICSEDIESKHGHNADPVADGRCCDVCNAMSVIPARLKHAFKESSKRKEA